MCNTKRILVFIFVTGIMLIFFYNCTDSIKNGFIPEVVENTASRVTIVWQSQEDYSGKVAFRRAASDESPRIIKEETPGKIHELVLDGLSPGTRYVYWHTGTDTKYQFQTQPAATEPFSFICTWGNIAGSLPELYIDEIPDFIFSLTHFTPLDEQVLIHLRPFIPVYDTRGIVSPVLELFGEQKKTGLSWRLNWGGLGFIIVNDLSTLPEHLIPLQAHTLGFLADSELFLDNPTPDTIKQPGLHSLLLNYNKQYPAHPAAFVIVPGDNTKQIEIDSITYLELPVTNAGSGYIRIDIDIETISAVYDGKDIVLKSPPLKEKRTCEECRRLADQGAYEKSIRAYKEFIESNKGHFQIDDAYYAIAEIFDTKLFNYKGALEYYTKLIEEYKDSSLASIARQRINYITQYAEYDFRPLAEFERIRQVEYVRKKDNPEQREELFSRVELLPVKYPKSKLLPVISYWYANQLREFDVQKAVSQYLQLAENYPESDYAGEVYWEVGETYYNAGFYNDAINAFEKALLLHPGAKEDIQAQIQRCRRNINRFYFAIIAAVVLFAMACAGIFIPRRGIKRPFFVQSLVLLPAVSGLFFILGWFMYEQFTSISEYILLSCCLGVAVAFSFPFARAIAVKLMKEMKAGVILLGIMLSALSFICAAYIVIYLINQHYLVIFGL